jgi:hypothetical protein
VYTDVPVEGIELEGDVGSRRAVGVKITVPPTGMP